ncbi:hypothetical protein D3C80_1851280 [compost metagenome]
MTLLDQRLGDGQHAPFGKAWAAKRAGITQNQNVIGRHIQIFIVDCRLHLGVAIEDQCRTFMEMKFRIAGGGLDHSTIRAEIAA